ncbi:MAG: GAF domain-containing protein [Caldilineae bacterium]|nr:MAG: GAF domain-containing protein [Caldilineae bacterium]
MSSRNLRQYVEALRRHMLLSMERNGEEARRIGEELAQAGLNATELRRVWSQSLQASASELPAETAEVVVGVVQRVVDTWLSYAEARSEPTMSSAPAGGDGQPPGGSSELEERLAELVALNTLSQRVSSSLSPQEVVRATIEALTGPLAPDLALVYLRQSERLLLAASGPPNTPYLYPEMPEHRVGECLCGLAASEGRPIYSEDIHCDLRCTWEECKRAGLRSFAALPLSGRDGIIGVLALASATRRDFSKQRDFLETVAAQVSMALQNALLHEEIRTHARELEDKVARRTAELQGLVDAMVGREVRMAELKDAIRALRNQLLDAGLTPIADDPLAPYMDKAAE